MLRGIAFFLSITRTRFTRKYNRIKIKFEAHIASKQPPPKYMIA